MNVVEFLQTGDNWKEYEVSFSQKEEVENFFYDFLIPEIRESLYKNFANDYWNRYGRGLIATMDNMDERIDERRWSVSFKKEQHNYSTGRRTTISCSEICQEIEESPLKLLELF